MMSIETIAIIIAGISLLLSIFTIYDNKFKFKEQLTIGKQIKLHNAVVDRSIKTPAIYATVGLSNNGGKAGFITDLKLEIEFFDENNSSFLEKNFLSMRNIDYFIGDMNSVIQQDVEPIMITGKSVQLKKIVFLDTTNSQNYIDKEKYSMILKLYIKKNGQDKWTYSDTFKTTTFDNIWDELNLNSDKFKIVDIIKD